jgi:hypothetical protein
MLSIDFSIIILILYKKLYTQFWVHKFFIKDSQYANKQQIITLL